MSSAGGRGEIEAAKRSLSTAKKWEASTAERLKDAEQQVSAAKNEADSAREQVKEAEKYLLSVEKKWEVIDVDIDSEDGTPRKKRQKQNNDIAGQDAARGDSGSNLASSVQISSSGVDQSAGGSNGRRERGNPTETRTSTIITSFDEEDVDIMGAQAACRARRRRQQETNRGRSVIRPPSASIFGMSDGEWEFGMNPASDRRSIVPSQRQERERVPSRSRGGQSVGNDGGIARGPWNELIHIGNYNDREQAEYINSLMERLGGRDDNNDEIAMTVNRRQRRGRIPSLPRSQSVANEQRGLSRRSNNRKARSTADVALADGWLSTRTSPEKAVVDEAKKARNRTRKSNAATKLKSQGGRGGLASIDAVRIAVGKKVFKSKCKLSFQFGTKEPYILFSYIDGKGNKCEHSVYLNNDELKEVNYFVESDDDSLGNDADESMTVMSFRITPTEKNGFDKYSSAYQEESEDEGKTERRYISVEFQDIYHFQVSYCEITFAPVLS